MNRGRAFGGVNDASWWRRRPLRRRRWTLSFFLTLGRDEGREQRALLFGGARLRRRDGAKLVDDGGHLPLARRPLSFGISSEHADPVLNACEVLVRAVEPALKCVDRRLDAEGLQMFRPFRAFVASFVAGVTLLRSRARRRRRVVPCALVLVLPYSYAHRVPSSIHTTACATCAAAAAKTQNIHVALDSCHLTCGQW